MTEQRIIIGSETEYGLLVTTEDGRAYGGNDTHVARQAISAMLSEAFAVVGGGFKGGTDTFASVREHQEAEEFMRRRGIHDISEKEWRRFAQRRGYTGSMLQNGARFYNDLMHPEYSCPECRDPHSAAAAQLAGDRIVAAAAQRAEESLSAELGSAAKITIVKNNSDGKGNSYAGHENYLISPRLFERVTSSFSNPERNTALLFLIARQIVTGAGKAGDEFDRTVPFQITQRADFFRHAVSPETTSHRGIINTRDIPYGDERIGKRLHIIVGDSNRSHTSLFLKFGATALFLMMLDGGFLKRERFAWYGAVPERPIETLRSVSRDLTLAKTFLLRDGRSTSAHRVMNDFARLAEKFVAEEKLAPVWQRAVAVLMEALAGLSGDRHEHPVSRSLDWVAVERVLMRHLGKSGGHMGSDACQAMDLDYRMLDEHSLFSRLESRGLTQMLVSAADAERFVHAPPPDTRAWLRAEVIRRYGEYIDHLRWDRIYFYDRAMRVFANPFEGLQEAQPLFRDDPSFEEFIARTEERYAHFGLWTDRSEA